MYKKFNKLGLTAPTVVVGDCFPSGVAAATFLKSAHPNVKRVYVAGTSGLVTQLTKEGFECLGGSQDDNKIMTDHEFLRLAMEDPMVDAVVVGYDTAFNYYKIARSSLCFQRNPNCLFIATNGDISDRIGKDWLLPGNGAGLAAVAAAVSSIPDAIHKEPIITGKPDALFGEMAVHSCMQDVRDPSRILVVGDRVDTDIMLAKNCGFKSCLVLSGVTRVEDLDTISVKPDFVVSGVVDFLPGSPDSAF